MEHRTSGNSTVKQLPKRKHFYNKLLKFGTASFLLLGFSLLLGVLGYHAFFGISWTDSLLNASMILTGMGPVDRAVSTSAKLFASFYALYSGMAFLTATAILLSPILHRFLHKFHLDIKD